jgi:hypothetical protein
MKKITYKNIEKILGFKLDKELRERVNSFDLKYRKLSKKELDHYLNHCVNVLTSDITISGKHRITEWEKGWDENLTSFNESKNIQDLIPKYHSKNRIVRWNGDVVMPLTENFDYKIHICFVDAILRHYSKGLKNVFEFGCGPAYHLIRLKKYDENINVFGTDWTTSSQKIIENINHILNMDIKGINLDFFNPDYNIEIPKNSAIYTVASLEQIGDEFGKIVDFMIEKKPSICIHMEPIDELLDKDILVDNLSIKYFRKRNYLNGFLPYLESLEEKNKIKILKKQRIFSGSYFIEGHSLIVWKPL